MATVLLGCCSRVAKINDPPYPSHTNGWNKYQLSESTVVYGDFVIRKGQSVNDGQYGIEAVELYPARCEDTPGADLPGAELRFFKVSDNSTICRSTFKRGSATLDESNCEKAGELIWTAKDFERPDDLGIPSNPSKVIRCESFPLSSYSFVDVKHGGGNIQVRP